jgi:formylglycine-generating enzyme required for sulfatase activity/mono/diheme cytochrome c family protein
MNMKSPLPYALATSLLVVAQVSNPACAADKVDFVREIKPLLEVHCVSCHTSKKPKGDLVMETRAANIKGGEKGTALVPGQPDKSPLYTTTILPAGHEDIMPPKGEPLSKEQTDTLKQWIQEGAAWPDSVTLKTAKKVKFVEDIKPILEVHCLSCHKEGNAEGKLNLETRALALKGGDNGPSLVPGLPGKSTVFTWMVVPADDERLMPPPKKGGPLDAEITDTIANWIAAGAPWPEDEKLTVRKKEEAAGAGDDKEAKERAAVAEIHKKVMVTHKEASAGDMKLYTNSIPGTTVSYSMVPVAGGEFLMGSPDGEAGHKPDEAPQVKIKLSPFWMGQCEVSWNEFELFMYPDYEKESTKADAPGVDKISDAVTRPSKPYVEMSFGMGKDGFPAISMTQHAASKYCEWLSAKTGHFYRLPTEAEWEYACRAGTTTAYSWGNDPAAMGDYAWYAANSDNKYQKIGKKKPNPWGLYDIHGNVSEWALDLYSPDAYKQIKETPVDPWSVGAKLHPRVARGGSWDDQDQTLLRSAARKSSSPDWSAQDPQLPQSIWYHTDAQFLGFRLVRPLKVPSPEEMQKYWNSALIKD